MRPEKWRPGSVRKILRLTQKKFLSPAWSRMLTVDPSSSSACVFTSFPLLARSVTSTILGQCSCAECLSECSHIAPHHQWFVPTGQWSARSPRVLGCRNKEDGDAAVHSRQHHKLSALHLGSRLQHVRGLDRESSGRSLSSSPNASSWVAFRSAHTPSSGVPSYKRGTCSPAWSLMASVSVFWKWFRPTVLRCRCPGCCNAGRNLRLLAKPNDEVFQCDVVNRYIRHSFSPLQTQRCWQLADKLTT